MEWQCRSCGSAGLIVAEIPTSINSLERSMWKAHEAANGGCHDAFDIDLLDGFVSLAYAAGAPLTPATVTPRPSGRTLGPSGALRSSHPPGHRPAAAGGLGPLGGVQTLLSSPARRLSCLGSSKG